MQTAMIFTMAGLIQPQGMKLVNVAEHLEIAMDNAHDSSCDIETTKKIADRFISYLQRARELNGENPKV
jgi:hypothetical protein